MGPHTTLSVPEVRELLATADATSLQPGLFPVPVRHAGRWWHQLLDTPDTADFIEASAEMAARYENLLARREQARAAAERASRR